MQQRSRFLIRRSPVFAVYFWHQLRPDGTEYSGVLSPNIGFSICLQNPILGCSGAVLEHYWT